MNPQPLRRILARHGIDSFGICDFRRLSTLLPSRSRDRIPAHARSVIVCAFPYYVGEYPQANVCKYAMVPDYHTVVRAILEPVCEELAQQYPPGRFTWFSDISALPEHECALAAGLGFSGRNGLVIHPVYGSFFVIGEIVTDCVFPFSTPSAASCQSCGACAAACPAGAIGPEGIDYTRCLSAVTQRKGELTEAEQALVRRGGLMWGCDRCPDCCPHNQGLPVTPIRAFSEDVVPVVGEENLPGLIRTRAFGWRGKAVLLRNLSLLESE